VLWTQEQLEAADFTVDTFSLRTSQAELLQCAFFELDRESDIFSDNFGDEAAAAAEEEEGRAGASGLAGTKRSSSEESLDTALEDTIVVYMHTNAANLAQAKEVLPLCRRLSCSLLCYDLRGHGRSEGSEGIADLATNLLDLERVMDWARSKAKRAILWCRGLSTCVGVTYVQKQLRMEVSVNKTLGLRSFIRFESPVKYLVLDSPFISVERVLKDAIDRTHAAEYEWVPKNIFGLVARFFRRSIRKRARGMDPFDIKPVKQVPQLTIPATFLLPTNDDFIPPFHGTDMAAMYGGPVMAKIFEGTHYTPRTRDTVLGLVWHIHSHIDGSD